MFSLTIVVSFHGTFVTKIDRAYRCLCFFRNIKHLTSAVDMSPIGTTELINTAKMPTCTYTIHAESPQGPAVAYGQVGDRIYHVWECDDDTHGFLVHSCFVNDGRGTQFDLMDVDGCPIDPIIQPEVTYDDDLKRAVAETWGYKFSDTSVLNYQCVVELCKKDVGECEGLSPPSCGRTKREVKNAISKRTRRRMEVPAENVMDLIASVNMLDTLDEDGVSDPRTERFIRKINSEPTFHPRSGIAIVPASRMCLSNFTIAVFTLTVALTFIISAIATAVLFRRTQFVKPFFFENKKH
ncbi:unnamed protein product [Toxocara canis]|uniref:ZP domain-containing protein n=1 Tax=Toxocara canis TaxID=6265 RepID=A0A183UZH4_TOXCA|nr:unnamed protein product [Toxocara canis]